MIRSYTNEDIIDFYKSIIISAPKKLEKSYYGDRLFAQNTVNSKGLFGKELLPQAEVLAAGCSTTSGFGVPYKFSWSSIVSCLTKKTVNTISYPSAPVEDIIKNIYSYIVEYGAPKTIYVLLPDLARANIGIWEKNNHIKYLKNKVEWDWNYKNYFFKNTKSLYKDFFGVKRNIPLEIVVQHAVTQIINLENFCKINNITLKIFSWSAQTDEALSLFDSYADPMRSYGLYHDSLGGYDFSCHEPVCKEMFDSWLLGQDKPNPHPGIHHHLHMVERFLQKAITQEDFSKIFGKNN